MEPRHDTKMEEGSKIRIFSDIFRYLTLPLSCSVFNFELESPLKRCQGCGFTDACGESRLSGASDAWERRGKGMRGSEHPHNQGSEQGMSKRTSQPFDPECSQFLHSYELTWPFQYANDASTEYRGHGSKYP